MNKLGQITAKFITTLIICCIPHLAMADNDCSNIFDGVLQTHSTSSSDKINFNCRAQIFSNPSTTLESKAISNPGGSCPSTCISSDCSASGNPVVTIDAGDFQEQVGGSSFSLGNGNTGTIGSGSQENYTSVTVNNDATINFTSHGNGTEYYLDSLELKDRAVANLVAGNYWIKSLTTGNEAKIKVVGSGTVRIFVQNGVQFKDRMEVNYNSGVANAAKQLFLYSYDYVTLNNDSRFVGFIYAVGSLQLKDRAELLGAAIAKDINLNNDSKATYDSTAKGALDLGFLCGQTNGNGGGNGGNGNNAGNNCANVLYGGLQTHGTSSSNDVVFKCRAQVFNNPTTVLTTKAVDNPSGSCANTCISQDCSASGTPAAELDAGTFQAQSGGSNFSVGNGNTGTIGSGSTYQYAEVNVGNSGTINFTSHGSNTVYKLDKLTLGNGAIANFVAGDYWIKSFTINNDVKINVAGSGTVRIFVQNYINAKARSEFNYNSGVANAAKQLFVYSYGDITLNNDVKFVGFMYAQGSLDLKARAEIVGGVLVKDAVLRNDSKITYDSVARGLLDLGFLCPVVSGATHFTLDHAATGIYCFKQRITVTAKQNANTFTDYDSTIVLDTGTNRGTWTKVTGNGSFADSTADDGLGLYTFAQSDNGVAVFDLYYTRGTSTVDVEVYEQFNSSIRDDDNSGSINFYEYGLVISGASFDANNPPEGQVYSAVQTAGIADTLYLTAYGQTNPTTGACGIISGYTGTKPLKFWQDYVDPNTGTITEIINGTSIGGTEAGAVALNISFSNGTANVSSLYRDVGKIRVLMKDENSLFPLVGSTSSFIVKPAKFAINVQNNPAATDHNGTVFKKAGEAFTVTVTSQDNDGNTTPNFGNESTLEKPMVYSSQLVLPSGGRNGSNNDGAIGNGDNFGKINPGIFRSTALSFDEVGIIKLTAQISSQNYLGAGGNVTVQTGNIGRFIPDHFDLALNTPSIASAYNGISTFSYLGQNLPFQTQPIVTATAKSSLGSTTQNYAGNFFKMSASTISQTYSTNSTQATFNSAAAESTNPNVADNANGTATIAFSDGGGFMFEKVVGVNASPFDAEIELATNITDTDNVIYANNPYKIGGTTAGTGISFVGGNSIYQGRLNILDNAGHEELELVMPIQAEYFDGSDYIVNTLDSFTLFNNPANINLSSDPVDLVTNPSVNTLVGGFGSIILSPPANGIKGNVIVTLLLDQLKANLPYLQHDWDEDGNSDGVFDDNPSGFATFGIYEGKKNVIFLEEITD